MENINHLLILDQACTNFLVELNMINHYCMQLFTLKVDYKFLFFLFIWLVDISLLIILCNFTAKSMFNITTIDIVHSFSNYMRDKIFEELIKPVVYLHIAYLLFVFGTREFVRTPSFCDEWIWIVIYVNGFNKYIILE